MTLDLTEEQLQAAESLGREAFGAAYDELLTLGHTQITVDQADEIMRATHANQFYLVVLVPAFTEERLVNVARGTGRDAARKVVGGPAQSN